MPGWRGESLAVLVRWLAQQAQGVSEGSDSCLGASVSSFLLLSASFMSHSITYFGSFLEFLSSPKQLAESSKQTTIFFHPALKIYNLGLPDYKDAGFHNGYCDQTLVRLL